MDELDRQLIADYPCWRQVLQIYLDLTAETVERPLDETGVRWADRIPSLEEIPAEELSIIHGRLIAVGWLKFQFEVGQSGLMYRVTSEGRSQLNRMRDACIA